jgi:dihydropteroate synthase
LRRRSRCAESSGTGFAQSDTPMSTARFDQLENLDLGAVPENARLYVRPLGLLGGESAKIGIERGWALAFAGRQRAYTAAELWWRDADGIRQTVIPAAQLVVAASRHAGIAHLIERLAVPSSWPAGLPDRRPLLMGVVNVTPDSFSDGGLFLDRAAAIAQGRRLHAEGADIVDVGGESTRPRSATISVDEEISRVVPVIQALAKDGILVSIDTRKAEVMRAAIGAGAGMINDISALRHDPDSLAVAGASGLPVVLMHIQGEPATMQQDPRYERAALDVYDHLEEQVHAWAEAGFDRSRLIVDPGIGFGKSLEHNLDILGRLGLYQGLGLPVLLGASRKSFIARIAGDAPAPDRLAGSIAAALAGLAQGVAILRVHDLAATSQAALVAQALAI